MLEIVRQFKFRWDGGRTIFERVGIFEVEQNFVLSEGFWRFPLEMMEFIERTVYVAEFGFRWLQKVVEIWILCRIETIV